MFAWVAETAKIWVTRGEGFLDATRHPVWGGACGWGQAGGRRRRREIRGMCVYYFVPV
ncbi:hypothetical protein SBA6_300021 [Candidatus Sulfopaludibacter sp. SbA6]|nr:hypothetical protein SBA6_300021 [Candidatus Sulfopaludibacter sp. SbA6]